MLNTIAPMARLNAVDVSPPKMRPIRLRCEKFNIGNWAVSRQSCDKSSLEAKFLFSRKKFVWEWRMDKIGRKRKIEIPFNACDGIYGEMLEPRLFRLRIQLGDKCMLFEGTQAPSRQTKWNACDDFTNGCAFNARVHELDLAINESGYRSLLEKISEYSLRFREIIERGRLTGVGSVSSLMAPVDQYIAKQPVEMAASGKLNYSRDVGRSIPIAENVAAAQAVIAFSDTRKRSRVNSLASLGECCPSPMAKKQQTESLRCSCIGGCIPGVCSCISGLQPCSAISCGCTQCASPLNDLQNLGVDLSLLRSNVCFVDHAHDDATWSLLQSYATLPCCQTKVRLVQTMVPGFTCGCGHSWMYSLCWRRFLSVDEGAYHCKICKTCQSFDSSHCSDCGRCASSAAPCSCSVGSEVEILSNLGASTPPVESDSVMSASPASTWRLSDQENDCGNSLSPTSISMSPVNSCAFGTRSSSIVSCVNLGKEMMSSHRAKVADILPEVDAAILPEAGTDILLDADADILLDADTDILLDADTDILPEAGINHLLDADTDHLVADTDILVVAADNDFHLDTDSDFLPETGAVSAPESHKSISSTATSVSESGSAAEGPSLKDLPRFTLACLGLARPTSLARLYISACSL